MLLAAVVPGLRLVHPQPATTPHASAPDELLPMARAAARGEPDAVITLLTAVGGPILRTVRRVMGSAHPDVDDVTQDAAMALLEALPKFRGDCSVVHFAHRVAVLTAMAARRRVQTRMRYTDCDWDADMLADEQQSSPFVSVLSQRRRDVVRELLDELPEATAEALALHFVLGLTVDEIAAAASVPPNTVWSRLRLGKDALRRKLASDARLAELTGGEE